jgi:hypothetical protein
MFPLHYHARLFLHDIVLPVRDHVRVTILILAPWLGLAGSGCTAPDTSTAIYLADHAAAQQNGEPASVTLEFETRLALAPALPSRLGLDLLVPAEPELTLSIATSALGSEQVWAPVEFRVLVQADGDGHETIAFEERLTHAQANRWLDRRIDLATWEGRQVNLVLDTRVCNGLHAGCRRIGAIPSFEAGGVILIAPRSSSCPSIAFVPTT